MEYSEVKEITPEKAREMLIKSGMEISLGEAEEVLKFLRKLAKIAVAQHLREASAEGYRASSSTGKM